MNSDKTDGKTSRRYRHEERQGTCSQQWARIIWLSCYLWFLVSVVQIQLTRMDRILGALTGRAKLLLGYSNQKPSKGWLQDRSPGLQDPWLGLLDKWDDESEEAFPSLYVLPETLPRTRRAPLVSNMLFNFSAWCWPTKVLMRLMGNKVIWAESVLAKEEDGSR